jgi:hypothetical protein
LIESAAKFNISAPHIFFIKKKVLF